MYKRQGLVHAQPVLEQQNAVIDQHLFKARRLLQKRLVLRVGAIAHHPFHAGAVVPTAVHQDQFAAGRQMRHIALEIPLRAFAVVGLRQRHHPALARVEMAGDGLDHAALAGGVAAFHQHQGALIGVAQPARHADQLQLQRCQQLFIGLAFQVRHAGSVRRSNAQAIRPAVDAMSPDCMAWCAHPAAHARSFPTPCGTPRWNRAGRTRSCDWPAPQTRAIAAKTCRFLPR